MATSLTVEGIIYAASQDASTNANTMDDYEEGSWTPTNTNSGERLQRRNGFYTKFGRCCEIRGDILVKNTTSTTAIATAGDFGGLPFTSANQITDDSRGEGSGVVTYNNIITRTIGVEFVHSATTFRFIIGATQQQLASNKNAKFAGTYATDG